MSKIWCLRNSITGRHFSANVIPFDSARRVLSSGIYSVIYYIGVCYIPRSGHIMNL